MISNKRITLCFPCRNEGNHLKAIVKQVPTYVDELIIVSNRSSDNTVKVAQSIGGRVRVIEDNRTVDGIGYGYAHMSGIRAATGDIIAGADADGTYPVEEIDKIVAHLIKEKHDFISCNRYPTQKETEIPLKLRLGVTLLNWEMRLLYGVPIKDALSGMWVFQRKIINKLNLTAGDWNLSLQIKVNAAIHPDIRFAEYSVAQRRRLGETKQDYFKTGFNHASWLVTNKIKRS